MAGGVRWAYGPSDSRILSILFHGTLGVPIGLAIALAGLAVTSAVDARVAVGLFGVATLLTVLAALALWRGESAGDGLPGATRLELPDGTDGVFESIRPVGLLLSAVVSAALFTAVGSLGVAWVLGAALIALVVTAGTVGLLSTEGELHPEDRTLRYGDDEIPLRALSRVRARRIGGYTFLWCTFVRGSGRTPGLVVVPAWVYDDERETFDAGVAASKTTLGDPDRPLRLVAYGFGSGMLLLGVLSTGVLYVGDVSLLVGTYVGGSLALLGAFFLVLGRYET